MGFSCTCLYNSLLKQFLLFFPFPAPGWVIPTTTFHLKRKGQEKSGRVVCWLRQKWSQETLVLFWAFLGTQRRQGTRALPSYGSSRDPVPTGGSYFLQIQRGPGTSVYETPAQCQPSTDLAQWTLKTCETGLLTPVLQLGKPRLREIEWIAPGSPAWQWQPTSEPGSGSQVWAVSL